MFTINVECGNCRNEDICKWCNDMKLVQTEMIAINSNVKESPICVNAKCNSFQAKSSGFIPGQRD